MNQLLKNYVIDTQYPGVSGIEHVQMLQNRTRLAETEATLTVQERQLLVEADQRLISHANEFWQELKDFIDLAVERQTNQASPQQWWWYLDVIAELPGRLQLAPEDQTIFA